MSVTKERCILISGLIFLTLIVYWSGLKSYIKIAPNLTLGDQYVADSVHFVNTRPGNQGQAQHGSSIVNVSQSHYSNVHNITSMKASNETVSPRKIDDATITAFTSTMRRKVESTTTNSEISMKKTVTMNKNTTSFNKSVTDSAKGKKRTITSVYVKSENINNTTTVTMLDKLLNRTEGDSKRNKVTIQPGIANKTAVLEKAGNGSSSNNQHNVTLFITARNLTNGRLGNQMFRYASLLGIARAQDRQLVVSPGSDLQNTFKLQHVADLPESKGAPNLTLGDQYVADSVHFVNTRPGNQGQAQHGSSIVNVSQSHYSNVHNITSMKASNETVSPRKIDDATITAFTSTMRRKVESTTTNSEISMKKTVTMNKNTTSFNKSVTDSAKGKKRTITSVYVKSENINNTTTVTMLDKLLNRTEGDSKRNKVTIQPGIANKTAVLEKAGNGSSSNNQHNVTLFITARNLTNGRLGNQMFRYASLLGIARAQDRQLVVSPGSDLQNTFKLQHVADLPESKGWPVVSEEHAYAFDKRLMNLTLRNVSIAGFLQSRRYFHEYADEVRQEFVFLDSVANEAYLIVHSLVSQRKGSLFVGVHIRRGDFLKQSKQKLGYGVPEKSYFLKAFDWMQSKFPNRHITYLVASDDLNWCKEYLNSDNVIPLPDASPAVHMAILSSCDHVILSGGSYGWWSAWLSGGYVIYFKGFMTKGTTFGDTFTPSLYYPSLWIGMGN